MLVCIGERQGQGLSASSQRLAVDFVLSCRVGHVPTRPTGSRAEGLFGAGREGSGDAQSGFCGESWSGVHVHRLTSEAWCSV